jgi:hypothetical protein
MGYVYLVFLLALVPGAVFAALRSWQSMRRGRELDAFASQHGLDHYEIDPFALIDHAFDLFRLGERANCRNVVAGAWDGVEVRAAELWFDVPSRRSDSLAALGGRSLWDLSQHRGRAFSFAMAEIDAALPHIAIRRRGNLEIVTGGAEPGHLRFESDRFNHRYEVRCADPQYAWQFVDVGMMQWLVDMSDSKPALSVEAAGNRVLVSCARLRPSELGVLFRAARRFHDLVPRMVLRRFPLVVRPG